MNVEDIKKGHLVASRRRRPPRHSPDVGFEGEVRGVAADRQAGDGAHYAARGRGAPWAAAPVPQHLAGLTGELTGGLTKARGGAFATVETRGRFFFFES